jgi:hypothetical protein
MIMEVNYVLYAKSLDDKEKLISALTNSGYIIGAELEQGCEWKVSIYNRKLESKAKTVI